MSTNRHRSIISNTRPLQTRRERLDLATGTPILYAATSGAFAQSGWQSNGYGGVNGTGNNFGGGYQSNGYRGVNGTGNNFGSGWQSNGYGG